eukprot:14342258-Alexandrium_andersonii.AAC.1
MLMRDCCDLADSANSDCLESAIRSGRIRLKQKSLLETTNASWEDVGQRLSGWVTPNPPGIQE